MYTLCVIKYETMVILILVSAPRRLGPGEEMAWGEGRH